MSEVILTRNTNLLKRDDEIRRLTIPTDWAKSCNIQPHGEVIVELRKGKHGFFIAVYSKEQIMEE